MPSPRIAVVGHVEHVTLGRVDAFPSPGDIVHFSAARMLAAGGGGIAFAQLLKSDAEVLLFTAVGQGDAGAQVRAELEKTRAHVHCATREALHPRVLVIVDAEGRRTIFVPEPPLQPRGSDALPWDELATCDAVYFTGSDPESLHSARKARKLVVSARRRNALEASGISPDVVVGSVSDPRENAPFEAYRTAPSALLLTDGPRPIRLATAGGFSMVPPPRRVERVVGDYGAGDSFAAALTYFVACGLGLDEAARRAAPYGAAVLSHASPFDGQAMLTREEG
jgi:ribokinase